MFPSHFVRVSRVLVIMGSSHLRFLASREMKSVFGNVPSLPFHLWGSFDLQRELDISWEGGL